METNRPAQKTDETPLSPEEIKAIGEIELGPSKHEVFLNKHYKKLIYGGIALLLAASAGVGYYAYKNQQKEEAGALIVQAMGASSSEGAVGPAHYGSKALAKVAENYASTHSASTAEIMEALSLLTDPAHAEAGIARLETLAGSSPDDLIRARATSALASYYMQEKQDEKAMEYWQKVVALPTNPYTAIAYITLGDLSKNAGDIDNARNYYNQVKAASPNSALAEENIVGLRLALLGVDPPKEAQPLAQPEKQEQPAGLSPYSPMLPAASSENGDSFGGFSTLPGSNK